ncbi:CUE domain-containing protein [Nocardia sp. CWNU-33]|uniref:CUE domain-containing protein n=1 Tax=Nocardia sp. CWNU-33 TaxID=3392117 RepID=UPI00398F7DBB
MIRRAGRDHAGEQVHRLAASLQVPRPWRLETFIEHVCERVGKPIVLIPQPDLADGSFPCGLVLERADNIVVTYDATSSGYHADHIVLHEIAHLLLDHAGLVSPQSKSRTLQTLFPDIDADSVLRVLARTDYDDAHESQAELFASLILSDTVGARSTSFLARAIFRD